MNFALTYYCNQECSYCFAKDAMRLVGKAPGALEMTKESLVKAIRFLKDSGEDCFRMIGGEPTLHPRFEEFFTVIAANGMKVIIFSNGVIAGPRTDFLARQENLDGILLNIREPGEYRARDWEKLLYVFSRLGGKISLSFRIYRLGFDPRFMFDLIEKFRLRKEINWAISCPSLIGKNDFLALEDHKKAVQRMVHFSRESGRRKITWFTDSGFIRCAFSPASLKALKENVNFTPEWNCPPPVEVSPDLRVFRCYGTAAKTTPGLSLRDFRNSDEITNRFLVKSLPLKRVGGMKECFSCKYMASGECSGGCLVHVLKRLPSWETIPAFF